jgi:hypothetical protein
MKKAGAVKRRQFSSECKALNSKNIDVSAITDARALLQNFAPKFSNSGGIKLHDKHQRFGTYFAGTAAFGHV